MENQPQRFVYSTDPSLSRRDPEMQRFITLNSGIANWITHRLSTFSPRGDGTKRPRIASQNFSPPAVFTAPANGVFSYIDVYPGYPLRPYCAVPPSLTRPSLAPGRDIVVNSHPIHAGTRSRALLATIDRHGLEGVSIEITPPAHTRSNPARDRSRRCARKGRSTSVCTWACRRRGEGRYRGRLRWRASAGNGRWISDAS